MLAHPLQRRALAEAGDNFVLSRDRFSSPGMGGLSNTDDVLVSQLAAGTIHHKAQLACVDNKDFSPSVTVFSLAGIPAIRTPYSKLAALVHGPVGVDLPTVVGIEIPWCGLA